METFEEEYPEDDELEKCSTGMLATLSDMVRGRNESYRREIIGMANSS